MAKREQTAEQLKFGWKLTDEQKNRVMQEVWDYLQVDCYDFTVQIGGLTLRAGELAELGGRRPRGTKMLPGAGVGERDSHRERKEKRT